MPLRRCANLGFLDLRSFYPGCTMARSTVAERAEFMRSGKWPPRLIRLSRRAIERERGRLLYWRRLAHGAPRTEFHRREWSPAWRRPA